MAPPLGLDVDSFRQLFGKAVDVIMPNAAVPTQNYMDTHRAQPTESVSGFDEPGAQPKQEPQTHQQQDKPSKKAADAPENGQSDPATDIEPPTAQKETSQGMEQAMQQLDAQLMQSLQAMQQQGGSQAQEAEQGNQKAPATRDAEQPSKGQRPSR